jgi:small conductance mechanosensitive channel
MELNIASLKEQILLAVTQYGGKILLAIAFFIVGRFIIGKLNKVLSNTMNTSHIDKDVQPFLLSLVTVGLNVMLLLDILNSNCLYYRVRVRTLQ